MPARFTVVDAQGAAVNLAALVSARAAAMSLEGTASEDVFEKPLLPDGVRFRATGVAVCSGFHFSASSHTGRELEADEAQGARE
jgi:hypothetical protein